MRSKRKTLCSSFTVKFRRCICERARMERHWTVLDLSRDSALNYYYCPADWGSTVMGRWTDVPHCATWKCPPSLSRCRQPSICRQDMTSLLTPPPSLLVCWRSQDNRPWTHSHLERQTTTSTHLLAQGTSVHEDQAMSRQTEIRHWRSALT